MEITPDTIKEIERMALAGRPRIVAIDGLSGDYYAVQASGGITISELPEDPPSITAHSEAGFTDSVKRLMQAKSDPPLVATVYVDPERVLALCDNGIGTDVRHASRVSYRLVTSGAMRAILAGVKMTHAELCHTLRTTWYEMMDDEVVGRMETVKQSVGKKGESTFRHGVEGLGAELTREVLGEAGLPNEVTITTAYYENAAEWTDAVKMDCVLDITWNDDVAFFRFEPRAEAAASAQALALSQIVAAIGKADSAWRVLAGSPAC